MARIVDCVMSLRKWAKLNADSTRKLVEGCAMGLDPDGRLFESNSSAFALWKHRAALRAVPLPPGPGGDRHLPAMALKSGAREPICKRHPFRQNRDAWS